MVKVLWNKYYSILIFLHILQSLCQIFSCSKCTLCYNKIFLPIEIENKLYCYDCYDIKCFKSKCYKFYIDKSYLEMWKYLDKCKKKPYLNCKHCKVKCSTLEFSHYYLLYKCQNYVHNIVKKLSVEIDLN